MQRLLHNGIMLLGIYSSEFLSIVHFEKSEKYNDGFISLDIVINIWSEAPGTGVDNMSSFTIYI